MAGIVLADNTLTNMSAEYKGAPGIHSFCMRQSSIEHNLIREVGYTGLSYNWPSPQGPTFGGESGDGNASVGYSADNLAVGNDVSRYMNYMMDGGGIHTIGKSLNTSVSRNYFHDLASGEQCESISTTFRSSCGVRRILSSAWYIGVRPVPPASIVIDR